MELRLTRFVLVTSLVVLLSTNAKLEDAPDETFSKFQTSARICDKCECSTKSNFYILNCANRGFENTLSNWPDHQNKTLKAIFSGNKIPYLEKFPNTNCSTMISMDHCGIKFLGPGLFENMKNVKYVDLSYNLITTEELSSEKFKGPYSNKEFEPIEVTHLNLAHNQLHSLLKNLFEHMPRLKQLNLEGNGFRVIDIQTQAAFNSIPNLEHLNLADNGLGELPGEVFASFEHLVKIDLSKNEMTFVPRVLAEASALEVLILDSNPIYELTDGTFNGVPNLVELSMNNMSNVVEIHSNTFRPLTKLRKLHLSDNKDLEVLEPDAFGGDHKLVLKELYMNNNNLIDIPSGLMDWSNLHIFEVNDNPFWCTCNLYNISRTLKPGITRNKAGPYCIGPEEVSYQVFLLDETVCDEDYIVSLSFRNTFQKRFSIIRVALITLSLIAITGTFIAIVVCFAKQRKYGIVGRSQFSRSTSVLYNPLNRQATLN